MMSRQEKRQQAASQVKEILGKKNSSLLQMRTPHQSTARTGSITNNCKNYFSNML